MPGSLLLGIALVAGYVFQVVCHPLRFRSKMVAGHRFVFEVALCGLLIFVCARAVTASLLLMPPISGTEPAVAAFHSTWPLITGKRQLVGTMIVAAFLAPASGIIANLLFGFWNRDLISPDPKRYGGILGKAQRSWAASKVAGINFAISQNASEIHELIDLAAESRSNPDESQHLAVGVTLDSGKTYTAWIDETAVPSKEPMFIELKPILSGFRKPTGEIIQNHSYQGHTIEVVVPIEKVASIHLMEKGAFQEALNELGNEAEKLKKEIEELEAKQPAESGP